MSLDTLAVASDEDRTLRRSGLGKDDRDLGCFIGCLTCVSNCSVLVGDNPASTRDGSFGKMWGLELINSCPFSLLRTRPDCTRQAKLTRSGPRAQPGPFAGIGQNYERILYDNSQLARVYLHAWQVTGKAFYRTITEEILDYVIREMTDPKGGFYSTQDADSEGEEGKFFVWTPAGIREVLGADAEAFIAAYGVTERGNFEGKNILELVGSLEDRQALGAARKKLFEVREQRIHPARDEKVLPAQAAVSFRERRT